MSVGMSLKELSGKKLSRVKSAKNQRDVEAERLRTLKLRQDYEQLRAERQSLEKQERDKHSKLKKAERILSKGAVITGKGIFRGIKETYKLYEKGKKSKRRSRRINY